jgi:predicted amidohydrolase YtcJ
MTPQEALQSLTTWAAWSAKRGDDLGRLLPGYRADLVVLDGPLEGTDPAILGRIEVQATVFAGEVVYRR